jgi:hypothetical protein
MCMMSWFTKFHRNQTISSKVTSGCRNKGGHLAPKLCFLMYNRSWLSATYDKCHTLTVSDLQWTVRCCFWRPWKDQPNIFQPLYASFIHSRYIAFIHITVKQKSLKTDESPACIHSLLKLSDFTYGDIVVPHFKTTGCLYCYCLYDHVHLANRSPELEITNLTITHPSIAHVLANGEHPCWTHRQFLTSVHLETKCVPSMY